MKDDSRLTSSGRFSPLRYPGGKGKVARFVSSLIKLNGLSDGRYVEPYAGGAAVAWELLLTGVVRRVEINDISTSIFAFWHSVLDRTEELCALINDTPVNLETWDKLKATLANSEQADVLSVGFALFFLNRTNRSGILNAGVIGGRQQTGAWKIDARYNKQELISRIERIASVRSRIKLTNMDAVQFLKTRAPTWDRRTLVYLDPPYYVKGGQLYHHYYKHEDHVAVASAVSELKNTRWMVSYDDVPEIEKLYNGTNWLKYTIGYSAREHGTGNEAMFFCPDLQIPNAEASMVELARETVIAA